MIKTGVIGVGRMGRNHARIYGEMGNLVGVCDSFRDVADVVAKKLGTKAYSDIDEFLELSGVEAVSIATHTSDHFQSANKCMEKGVHVLLEKPICATVEEAEKLISIARENGVTFTVGHIERHNPVVNLTREQLDAGRIGQIISICAVRASPFPARIADVGVIMDIGIHDLDVVRNFAGAGVRTISAMATRNRHSSHEDQAHILLGFENGILSHIDVNWLSPMRIRKMRITGTEGLAEMDYLEQRLCIYHPDGTREELAAEPGESLGAEIIDFLDSITGKKSPLVSPADALAALEMAKACEMSYRNNEVIFMQQ